MHLMNRCFFLTLIISPVFFFKIQAQQYTCRVKGKIQFTPVFCGGMRLTDEEMERFRPYPLAKTTFYLRTGDSNDISKPVYKEIVTNTDGTFEIDLPPGIYCIVEAKKNDSRYVSGLLKTYEKKSINYEAADKDCLRKWLATPDAVIIVKDENIENVMIMYYESCNWHIPCVQFTGKPPS